MKKIKNLVLAIFVMLLSNFVVSCYVPSPLYGNWSDNNGNKISFAEGGTFNISIIMDAENNEIFRDSGSFTVNENVIVFNASSGTIVTEWDIRGSILYIEWTTVKNGQATKQMLTLYRS